MEDKMRGFERRAVSVGNVGLEGFLTVPNNAKGLVIFAHGSGSGRHSPRNRWVAQQLERNGLGTLLFDLLTREEEAIDLATHNLRFDISFLAKRMVGAIDWARANPMLRELGLGLFGASTGAAAALVAAAHRPQAVRAVVSRGGRADLAGDALALVRAPTLLLVGELDVAVIGLNRTAQHRMSAPSRIEIVRGAGHLFEEVGTLEQVALRASRFFETHLSAHQPREARP
jgi:putative phosphoribosyl transferase